MLELRPYQSESVESLRQGFRDKHTRQVLAAPTGAGKSRIMEHMIRAAMDKGSRIMFVCERRILVEQFSKHLDNAGIDHGILMAGHWRFRPDRRVQIASAQTLERMESLPAVDLIFIDELHACFVAGTLIDGRPIESVKIGDYVNSFNHETGEVEPRRVTATFIHKADTLVTVKSESGESFTCTEDHPIFTQDGYVKANSLSHESVLQLINNQQHAGNTNVYTETANNSSVPSLRSRLPSFGDLCVRVKKAWNTHVLRNLCVSCRKSGASENSQELSAKTGLPVKNHYELRKLWGDLLSRIGICSKRTQTQFSSFLQGFGVSAGPQRIHNGNQQGAHAQASAKWWIGKDASQQSNEGRHHQEQGPNAVAGDWSQASSARRERAWLDGTASAAAVFLGRWLGGRILRANGMQEGARLPHVFEDRHSKQGKDDCYRGGRRESQQRDSTGTGCAEEFSTWPSRVVSVEVQKPGSLVASGTDCSGGQCVDVFNIEVDGNHNYFANGVLVHNCMRKSIIALIERQPNLRIIGATATPFHPAIGKHFSKVVSVTTMAKLVEEGFLVPFRVFVAKEIDTSGLKVVAGEWKKDDLEKRGQQIVGDVVADYVRISHDVFGEYRKTICFSCGIAHGAELVTKFQEVGINAVQISSEDDDEYRDEVLKDFAKSDSEIKVLISVAILSRGFDQSDVDYVILARPLKKSFSEHVQQVGRGARINKKKKMCVIQDNSGNWLRFADDWDKLYHDGVQELNQGQDAKPKKEPTEQQKEAAKCPKCSVIWGGGDVCKHCGFVRVKRNDVIAVAGEMVEIGPGKRKAEKFTAEFKADFYAQLLGYAMERGHNPGSAYYKYKEKFGVGPSMAKPEPKPAGEAVRAWITSQNIRRAKSKGLGA